MTIDHSEYQQYVNTLARLIETRRGAQGNEAVEKEADMAMRRMKAHVVGNHGEALWAACERDAEDTLRRDKEFQA